MDIGPEYFDDRYNLGFDKFINEFISIFGERHAQIVRKGHHSPIISICYNRNNILVMDERCHFCYKKDDNYIFIRSPKLFVINLKELSLIITTRGTLNENHELTTGATFNIQKLPIENRLWQSPRLTDESLIKTGNVYWNPKTKMFYYKSRFADTREWSYVFNSKSVGNVIQVKSISDITDKMRLETFESQFINID